MSYPTIIYIPEGEQFNNYDSKLWPLGTRAILQDGRRFVFVEAGTSALVAGKVQQSEIPDPDHDTLPVVTGEQNARTISFTNGSDEIEVNLYADGSIVTEAAAGVGEGYLLKIDLAHDSQASSTTVSMPLAPGYGLPLDLNTSDKITFCKNPYADVIISAAPPVALILGVGCSPIPGDEWGWLQTWGPAAVLIDDTTVIGGRVSPCGTAGASTVGAVEASGIIITATAPTIAQTTELLELGWCMEVAPTTGYGHIFLKIS